MKLYGFKTLRVDKDNNIRSLFYPTIWNSGELKATCLALRQAGGYDVFIDEVPEMACHCGIWGSAPTEYVAAEYSRANVKNFVCLIQGIGKTLLTKDNDGTGRTGFRTSKAKIIAILKSSPSIKPSFNLPIMVSNTTIKSNEELERIHVETYTKAVELLRLPTISLEAALSMTTASWEWWRSNG